MIAAEAANTPVTSAIGATHGRDQCHQSARRRHARWNSQAVRCFPKYDRHLFFNSIPATLLGESQLNGLQQLAALAREIRWRPRRLRLHVAGKMRLDHVLQLRPDSTQIGFK